ncbi:iron-regulated ABC transporter permease protein SufD [Motilibacter rhizosphaerae]|uniref:Iron-regulated ABC transporter permease protein SufD n=1 Tax=Motilibacter rhizosphaerae TaxID=598652 RepID=A0A4V2F3E1_9ACTN|nr:Fe-S cluster assembly protein SufD [Motilibacter rhizosphaerae]RZS82793.1 iron-regulated ABC transporter permease protein SufD [Motilibacter rhizosphaerae]
MTESVTDLLAAGAGVPSGASAGGPLAVKEHAHGPGAPKVDTRSRATEKRSFDPDDFGVPTGREEDWRFTPLEPLTALLAGEEAGTPLALDADLPEGVTVRALADGDPLLGDVPVPVDRVAALAGRRAGGATLVAVPQEARPAEPVVLRLRGADQLAWGHLVVQVGAFAKATVVLEHSGRARYAGLVSVLVGDGAEVELVSVQGWDAGSVHAVHQGVRLGRDAKLSSTQVTLGGDLVRVVETVEYSGPGGDAELRGISFADAGQHLEHRLFVDHAHPHCRSRVTYKSALQGESAHTVWVGDVLIRAAAEGTDTYELNRNLVLTDGARADSVPNLEIETGEIAGAGHASATGRFDDEQLFYLQARGIPEDEARRLVVLGFFVDVLQRISVPALRERLLDAIVAELEGGRAVASTGAAVAAGA